MSPNDYITSTIFTYLHSLHYLFFSFQCIEKRKVCDLDKDCANGADETSEACTKEICSESGRWKCPNEPRCLDLMFVCNGRKGGCKDGSDESEEGCTEDVCYNSGRWKCPGENKCLYPWAVCNGKADCKTGGDESPYLCTDEFCESTFLGRIDGGWKCPNETKCLDKYQVCDGYQNCNDAPSDETMCTEAFCEDELNRGFRCEKGTKCLNKAFVCNGNKNCNGNDDSDESEEACRKIDESNKI